MTLKDIKKAVNAALKKQFPECKVYGSDTVEGYTRPSFFVYVTQTFSETTRNAVHKNVEIEIDYIQKSPDEGKSMEFFQIMENLFGQKLQVEKRKLNTGGLNMNFQGEHVNIPVFSFEVEFWDEIRKTDNSETMKDIIFEQEIKTMKDIIFEKEADE